MAFKYVRKISEQSSPELPFLEDSLKSGIQRTVTSATKDQNEKTSENCTSNGNAFEDESCWSIKCDEIKEEENSKLDYEIDGKPRKKKRDFAAYWLLGFCNNFTYWVMITAAYDLLTPEGQMTILVADTVPATVLTFMAPILQLISVHIRVTATGLLCLVSYLILGLAPKYFVFIGVALASTSRGFSDTTFLGYASFYHRHVLSLWSSGTGVATFVGPLIYSGLTTLGLRPNVALLVFICVPFIIFSRLLGEKAVVYVCPLMLFYFFMYFTNQGLTMWIKLGEKCLVQCINKHKATRKYCFTIICLASLFIQLDLNMFKLPIHRTPSFLLEMVTFQEFYLTKSQQYSWNNTFRCLGTLISRSAHHHLLIPYFWMHILFVIIIMIVIGTEAYWHYLPSEFIVFTLLLTQGLLEGSAFRSTVFGISKMRSRKEKEFSLGVFPSSLFLPAVLAGLAAMPAHQFLCSANYSRV